MNVTGISHNETARAYDESGFETARRLYGEQKLDSAIAVLSSLSEYQRSSKSAGLLAADIMLDFNQPRQALDVLMAMLQEFPTDYYIHLKAGVITQIAGLQIQDRALLASSQRLFAKAVELNPFKAEYASQVYQQNMNQYRSQPATP